MLVEVSQKRENVFFLLGTIFITAYFSSQWLLSFCHKHSCVSQTFLVTFWALNWGCSLTVRHLFWALIGTNLRSWVWPFSISFNLLIFALLKKSHSNNWYGISIPLQNNWLQCCLRLISSLHHATKRKNSWCQYLTVSSTVDTWTANFVHGIIKSLIQQQVFLCSEASLHLDKNGICSCVRWKHT